MGIFADWFRGARRITIQREFDELVGRMTDGTAHPDAEWCARRLAKQLGIKPEPEGKPRRKRKR